MSTHWKIIRNLLGSLKPPRIDIVDRICTVLFEKEPCKVKAPLKAPKESRDFWKFLGFVEPNRVELFSREYLNYSNITWKRSLILKTRCVLKKNSKPRRVKNNPATGVTPSPKSNLFRNYELFHKITKFPPPFGGGFKFYYTSHVLKRFIPHVHHARKRSEFDWK